MSNIITICKRPRSEYQVIRYVDGNPLMMTSTKRGVITLYRLVRKATPDAGVELQTYERITDPEERAEAIERAVKAGYNVVEIAETLRARAKRR